MTNNIHRNSKAKAIAFILLAASCKAFTQLGPRHLSPVSRLTFSRSAAVRPNTFLQASPSGALSDSSNSNDEVTRLRQMAAKLRQEAATLEGEQKAALTNAAKQVFSRFDVDENGEVSVQELRRGLEKIFKVELPEKRVQQLVNAFDANNDGALQLDEFVGVDAFRNKLDALVRQERDQARKQAKENQAQAEAARLAEQQMELVNDKPPTNTDKVVSVLPYLFPLIDGLQFARFIVEGNPENPLSTAALVAYGLYRAIPLSGFLSFFALNFFSSNPRLNKLVRFNMQQAVLLDIALFAPAFFVALAAGVATQFLGVAIPPEAVELSNDAMFLALIAAVGYSTVSSLAGQLPNKLPVVSQRAENSMITPEMFDARAQFNPFDEEGNLQNEKDEDDSKN